MTSAPEEADEEERPKPIQGFSLPTIPLADEEDRRDEEEQSADQESAEESAPGDWLSELRGSTDEEEKPRSDEKDQESMEAPEPADIPDWLEELGPVREEKASSSDEDAFLLEGNSEEELERGSGTEEGSAERSDISEPPHDEPAATDIVPESETASVSDEDASPEPAEIPDWLQELGPVEEEGDRPPDEKPLTEMISLEEESAEEPTAEESEVVELPPWLEDVDTSPEEPDTPIGSDETKPDEVTLEGPSTADAESAVIEIPDWLEETLSSGTEGAFSAPEREEELSSAEETPAQGYGEKKPTEETPPEPVDMPSWLRETETSMEKPPSGETSTPFLEKPAEEVETPDWLSDLMAEPSVTEEADSPLAAVTGLEAVELEQDLERADIPDWLLDLRPSLAEGEEVAKGTVETEGMLKGLRGLIPPWPAIASPSDYEGLPAAEPDEASLARAELLESLLGQPMARPKPVTKEREINVAGLAERWLVAVILLVAVLGTLMAPLMVEDVPPLTQPTAASGASQLHEIIDALDANDNVLIAFDYGPPQAGELDAVAQPVLEHVIAQEPSVAIVTTRPDGSLVASALMSVITDSGNAYRLIGYRPGAATAVSQLLASVDTRPSLLVVLTSQPGPLRRWIEQAEARYEERLPVVAVGSAALEPAVSPYLVKSAGQLSGAIYGLRGAASYERLRGVTGDGTGRLDALAAGHLAVVGMMIVGAVFHALSRTTEGR